MRVTGWSKYFLDYIEAPPLKHVLTEEELLRLLVEQGRAINPNWRTTIAHAKRALGFKLRTRSRTYTRRAPKGGAR